MLHANSSMRHVSGPRLKAEVFIAVFSMATPEFGVKCLQTWRGAKCGKCSNMGIMLLDNRSLKAFIV